MHYFEDFYYMTISERVNSSKVERILSRHLSSILQFKYELINDTSVTHGL